MKLVSFLFYLVFSVIALTGYNLKAMEIVFGKKYPIAHKLDTKDLAWQSIQFEKDLTGKVIYKLQATHPRGIKLSYLKGKDYLLSEDIQKNMVRNFEVKQSEVMFDQNQNVVFEIVLPYDFQTRYLPLKFEKDDGYQEVVLRLRFGDYRFMLASRTLNTVSFVEAGPVLAAQPLERLFMKRSQLKKRAPKPVEEEKVSNVQVDDIYNDISKDLNIQSRIVTDVDAVLASESSEEVMDEFDVLVNKYLPSPEAQKAKTGSESLVLDKAALNATGGAIKVSGSNIVSYEDAQRQNGYNSDQLTDEQKQILDNPMTDKDYANYLNDATNVKIKDQDFDPDANIDQIIAEAVAYTRSESNNKEQYASLENDPALEGVKLGYDDEESDKLEDETSFNSEDSESESESRSSQSQSKAQIETDVEELFGFSNDNWIEPKSAPVLVIKPKPASKKRDLASFAAPKRNNFVEMVPSKTSPRNAPGANMDDLFGGGDQGPGVNNGLGF